MLRLRRRERGFTLLSMLMAIAIIGILTQNYMSVTGPNGKTFAQTTQDRARAAVTAVNLRTAQTEFFMQTQGRQLPPAQLRPKLDRLSRRMGSGGRFFVGSDRQLYNTKMVETPLFRDQFGDLPQVR